MDGTHSVLILRVGEKHTGARHMLGCGAELLQCPADQEAASLRLRGGIARGGGAVVLDRAGAGNQDAIAHACGAGEAELRFVGRTGERAGGTLPQRTSVMVIASSYITFTRMGLKSIVNTAPGGPQRSARDPVSFSACAPVSAVAFWPTRGAAGRGSHCPLPYPSPGGSGVLSGGTAVQAASGTKAIEMAALMLSPPQAGQRLRGIGCTLSSFALDGVNVFPPLLSA